MYGQTISCIAVFVFAATTVVNAVRVAAEFIVTEMFFAARIAIVAVSAVIADLIVAATRFIIHIGVAICFAAVASLFERLCGR